MALYRCAACGSPNVVTDTQKEGYDYVKGAIGTVVLGVGGAAAGINGKSKQVFKCAACGLTLSYAMPQSLKSAIDIGVESADAREHLTVDGIPVFWDYLTGKYPNIEHGAADVEVAKCRQQDEEQAVSEQAIQNATFRFLVAKYPNDYRNDIAMYSALIRPVYEQKIKTWEYQTKHIPQIRQQEFDNIISSEVEKRIQARESAYATAIDTYTVEKSTCEKVKVEAEETLKKLGAFDISKKMGVKKTIKEMTAKIATADAQIQSAEQAYQNDKNTFSAWLEDRKKQVLNEIEAAHPTMEEPEKPFFLLSDDEVKRSTAQRITFAKASIEILNVIIPGQLYTAQQVYNAVLPLHEFSIAKITGVLNWMTKQGFLDCFEETRNKFYCLVDFNV